MVFQHMGQIYHCGWVNDQYLSPYQTRAKWLPWLLRKRRPFIFIYRPLGPIYFNIWGIFTIVGVWMIITYHHSKPEPIGCLGCWEKAGPLYFNIGPWGPNSSNYGFIYHCGCVDDHYLLPYQTRATWLPWLLRKSRPFVFLYGPLGPLTFICGAKMVIHFHSCIMPHTCVMFGPWAYFSFWSTRGAKKFALGPWGPWPSFWGPKWQWVFILVTCPTSVQSLGPEATLLFKVQGGAKKFELGPLGPLTYILEAIIVVGFHPCNMPHKCAKFGPRGYFTFWVTEEQRNVLRRRKRRRRRRWRRKLN